MQIQGMLEVALPGWKRVCPDCGMLSCVTCCPPQVQWRRQRFMGKCKLRPPVFKSNLKQAKKRVPFDKIPGPTPKPAWNSPAACGLAHAAVDLETAAWCDTESRWDVLEDTWWCCLFRGKRIIVRHRNAEQWYLSLGDEIGRAHV